MSTTCNIGKIQDEIRYTALKRCGIAGRYSLLSISHNIIMTMALSLNEKYTQFHITVNEGLRNMNMTTRKIIFFKCHIQCTTETAMYISGIWLLIGLVRSL